MMGSKAVERVLGGRWVERATLSVSSRRLRILGYHGVPDAAAFRAQLHHLHHHYHPIRGADVVAHFRDGTELPERAVWVTFDDGRPSVVEQALPALIDEGVPATMFVCPGLFPDGAMFWQSTVLAGLRDGGPYRHRGVTHTDRSLVIALKSVPDDERRAVVTELGARIHPGAPQVEDAVTEEQLAIWTAAGYEVGNHTWDHPCLDQCDAAEQRRQIVDAHERLTQLLGKPPDLFAYPNGDWTPQAPEVLRELGYEVAPMFDHRIVSPGSDPLRLPRLRIDSDASVVRLRAILSGAHPAVFHARERVRAISGSRAAS